MTLFADDIPPVQRRRPRTWIGWVLILVAVIGVVVVGFSPAPYVIEKPGPVFDTLGTVSDNGKEVPLVDVTSATTYPTTGALDMLTVSLDGDRENPLNWIDTALAWLDPSKAVVPIDDVYPEGQTVQQSNDEASTEMQDSQKDAIAAAEKELGYDVRSTITVADVIAGEPAEGVLQKGDIIRTVGGTAPFDENETRSLIGAHGTASPLAIGITRAGKQMTVEVTPTTYQGATVVGIVLSVDYTYPVAVTIQLQNVGGPSAGQMFALGIIDKLTPGSLTGGVHVAGTGTITATGDIGAIGGIRQKMYGAVRAGATVFLAPASNCDEVVGHIPSGLSVYAVSNLSDSLADLKVVADGGDTSSLATCDAG